MKLTNQQAHTRFSAHHHGVLGTVHPERGADVVPVVFAANDAANLAVPIDRVKPKASSRLQRERNLAADPRATLLVEQWDTEDWSKLWWVRADLHFVGYDHPDSHLGGLLASKYPQYHERPFDRLLVFRILTVIGWAAA